MFAVLSSPRRVVGLWVYSLLVDSSCCRDGAFGF
jgi:hypothetical protein